MCTFSSAVLQALQAARPPRLDARGAAARPSSAVSWASRRVASPVAWANATQQGKRLAAPLACLSVPVASIRNNSSSKLQIRLAVAFCGFCGKLLQTLRRWSLTSPPPAPFSSRLPLLQDRSESIKLWRPSPKAGRVIGLPRVREYASTHSAKKGAHARRAPPMHGPLEHAGTSPAAGKVFTSCMCKRDCKNKGK